MRYDRTDPLDRLEASPHSHTHRVLAGCARSGQPANERGAGLNGTGVVSVVLRRRALRDAAIRVWRGGWAQVPWIPGGFRTQFAEFAEFWVLSGTAVVPPSLLLLLLFWGRKLEALTALSLPACQRLRAVRCGAKGQATSDWGR